MKAYNHAALKPRLSVTEIGMLHCMQYGKVDFHAEPHDFWVLMYVDKGQARVRIGDSMYAVEAGEVLLCAPGQSLESAGDWEGVCAGFVSFACEGGMAAVPENQAVVPDDAGRQLLADLFAEGAFCLEKTTAYALQIAKSRLTLLLLRLYEQTEKPVCIPENTEESDRMLGRRIAAHVRKNVNAPANRDEAAAALDISISKLEKVCRGQFGCSFRAYHAGKRLEKAKHLIRQRGMTFTGIATRLGYASVSAFSRCLKKETGYTPTEYRRWFAD